MTFVLVKKATLLLPSGPGDDGQHLFAVITNRCADDQCLLVSFSSVKPDRHFDPACVVGVGEHEFIKKQSYVEYRLARIMRCDHILKCVAGWTFTPKAYVSDALLGKLHAGVSASDFTPKYIQTYFDANKHR